MGVGVLVPSISKALTGAASSVSVGTLTANSSGTVPSASEDEWTQISVAASPLEVAANGPFRPFHFDSEYGSASDEILLSWRTPSSTPALRNGTFLFSCVTNQWRQTNTFPSGVDGDGNVRALGQRENYGMCYDHDRNCFWISAGSPSGTLAVAARYSVVDDIFYPVPNANFGIVNGRVLMGYHNNRVYSWRGEGFKYYNIPTDSMVALATPVGMEFHVSGQSGSNNDLRLGISGRGGINRTGNYLWCTDLFMDLWKADLSEAVPTFVKYPTTGDKPVAFNTVSGSGYPCGVVLSLDESRNVIVAYIGGSYENGAYDDGQPVNKTWVLDLDSLVWRFGPQHSAGDTIPGGGTKYVGSTGTRMMYDSLRQRVLGVFAFNDYSEVWEFKPRFKSRWESFEVPTAVGAVYGVNYVGFPFVTNAGSKNVNIAYCPATNRLYASGGDCGSNSGSASDTPGMWSMSMTDGTWRLDSGYDADSNWPYPQPNGFQDQSLLAWSDTHQKFVFGFNPGESYNDPGDFLWQYAQGVWFYDPSLYPDADAWTQDLTLAPADWETTNTQGPSSGCDYGGIYDDATDMVVAISSSGNALRRWHIGSMTVASNLSFTLADKGSLSARFEASKPVQVGREIWALGVYTNGGSIRDGKILRVNLDTGAATAYDTPAGVTLPSSTKTMKLETSDGKLVWVRIDSTAVGNVLGIHIFDPATLSWTEDLSRPAYGTFVTNASCSLPDGRICLAGGGNGVLPTHTWFYRAP